MTWYSLSYIPYARDAVKKTVSACIAWDYEAIIFLYTKYRLLYLWYNVFNGNKKSRDLA